MKSKEKWWQSQFFMPAYSSQFVDNFQIQLQSMRDTFGITNQSDLDKMVVPDRALQHYEQKSLKKAQGEELQKILKGKVDHHWLQNILSPQLSLLKDKGLLNQKEKIKYNQTNAMKYLKRPDLENFWKKCFKNDSFYSAIKKKCEKQPIMEKYIKGCVLYIDYFWYIFTRETTNGLSLRKYKLFLQDNPQYRFNLEQRSQGQSYSQEDC